MPTYVITAPNGKKYRVTGQGSKEEALAQVQRQLGMGAAMPETPPAPPSPTVAQRGSILPISAMSDGSWQFDSDSGLVGMAKRALTLPGDVYTGKVQMTDPATGRTSEEAIRRANEMAAVVTPMSPAMRAGEGVIPGARNTLRPARVEPPTAEALRQAGAEGYNAARSMGVQYKSQAVAAQAARIRNNLEQDGILAELAPKTFKIIEKLSVPPEGSTAPLTGLIAARRALKNARLDFTNPTEKLAAERVIKQLDEFIGKPGPKGVVAGPAASAAKTLDEANANYAASKRSNLLTGKLDKADRQAAVANSGLNIDNTIRQRANDILNSDKLQKGFNKLELAAIRSVAEGTAARNTVRYVGNLLGGGGGLGALLTGSVGGYMSGSPSIGLAGAALAGTGYAAKRAGGMMTRKAMEQADRMTRMRSPLYQQMLTDAPLEPLPMGLPSMGVRSGLLAGPSLLDSLFQREKV